MKKVLFDIRTAQTYYGRGVFRYCFDLVLNLAKLQSKDFKLFLLIDRNMSKIDEALCEKMKLPVIDISDFDKSCDFIFDDWIIGTFAYFRAPQKWGYVDYTFPLNVLKKCKKIIGIIHDMIPAYYPEECLQTYEMQVNYALQFETLKLVDHFLCNSQHTLKVASNLLHRPISDFTCIYGSTNLGKWENSHSKAPYKSSERKNNIVYVGGATPRKNYMGLAKAFCLAYKTGKIPVDSKCYIICSGELAGLQSYLENEQMEGKVIATGFISDQEMLQLVSTARASIFPSFYEGLGLPILESYAAGTPCFASNTTSTVEFVRKEDSFNPDSIEDISKTILKIFSNEDSCIKNLDFGRNLLKNLTWDKIAKEVLEYIKKDN